MKTIYIIGLLVALSINAFSQEDTTFVYSEIKETYKVKDNDDYKTIIGNNEIGGYGSFSVAYTVINDLNAMSFSARGAVILGHSFALGFAGTGFINEVSFDTILAEDYSLAGGYGGLFFEPIIMPNQPVHFSIPVVVGIGGVAYAVMNEDYYYNNNYVNNSDVFFVIEPGIELEINFTRYFRFALTGTYRFTSSINLGDNIASDALNGYSVGATFKFGKF